MGCDIRKNHGGLGTNEKKMSENNLREAKEKYDVKIVVKDIEELYLSLKEKPKNQ